jgi:Phage tail assembly chaperone protein, TAC
VTRLAASSKGHSVSNETSINGRVFSFGNIPALEAIVVEVAIARVIGEPLFKAFMDSKKTGATEGDQESAGAAAIGLMASKMDAKELIATMEIVFKYVSCDGRRVEINSTFTGRNKDLWLVFMAALKFNFSDFFPVGLLDSALAKATT